MNPTTGAPLPHPQAGTQRWERRQAPKRLQGGGDRLFQQEQTPRHSHQGPGYRGLHRVSKRIDPCSNPQYLHTDQSGKGVFGDVIKLKVFGMKSPRTQSQVSLRRPERDLGLRAKVTATPRQEEGERPGQSSLAAPRGKQPRPHLHFAFLASRTGEGGPSASATASVNVSGRHRKPVRGRQTRPVRGAPGLEGSWPATGHAGGPSRQDLSSSQALGEQRFLWKPRPGDTETCHGTRCLRGGPGISQEQGRMCPLPRAACADRNQHRSPVCVPRTPGPHPSPPGPSSPQGSFSEPDPLTDPASFLGRGCRDSSQGTWAQQGGHLGGDRAKPTFWSRAGVTDVATKTTRLLETTRQLSLRFPKSADSP